MSSDRKLGHRQTPETLSQGHRSSFFRLAGIPGKPYPALIREAGEADQMTPEPVPYIRVTAFGRPA
jgi:hypothetical protein